MTYYGPMRLPVKAYDAADVARIRDNAEYGVLFEPTREKFLRLFATYDLVVAMHRQEVFVLRAQLDEARKENEYLRRIREEARQKAKP